MGAIDLFGSGLLSKGFKECRPAQSPELFHTDQAVALASRPFQNPVTERTVGLRPSVIRLADAHSECEFRLHRFDRRTLIGTAPGRTSPRTTARPTSFDGSEGARGWEPVSRRLSGPAPRRSEVHSLMSSRRTGPKRARFDLDRGRSAWSCDLGHEQGGGLGAATLLSGPDLKLQSKLCHSPRWPKHCHQS